MQAVLRLKGKIRPEKQRSAGRCQQSAMSYQLSALASWLPAISRLLPKTYYLISTKEPSAVNSRLSDMARHVRAISELKPKTYQLSAIGSQLSETSRYVQAMSKLIAKAYYLISRRVLSNVSNQPSGLSNQSSALNPRLPIQNPLSPNTYKRIPLILFILVFVSCGAAMAQEHGVHTAPAAQAETEITPLKIGDKIPDELWDLPLQLINHPEGKESITLNDYRGKLIILDFWATWCAPCISSLNKLNDFQQEFSEDFLVVPITKESSQKAESYFSNKGWSLPSVVNNPTIYQYFPHKYIPHYIWINKDGNILATTGHQAVEKENIQSVLKGEVKKLPLKEDMLTFDSNQPLFIEGNGGDGNVKYRSLLSGPIQGLGSMASGIGDSPDRVISRVYGINSSILMLYMMAFNKAASFPEKRIILDVENPSLLRWKRNGIDYEEWAADNTYCYELITKPGSPTEIKSRMADDLQRFFGLTARFEKRILDCYVLSTNKDIQKSHTKGGDVEDNLYDNESDQKYIHNKTIDELFGYLNNALPLHVVDETNYREKLDLEFPQPDPTELAPLLAALNTQGLTLTKTKREIEFFIISEN